MPKILKKIAVMVPFVAFMTGIMTAAMTYFARSGDQAFLGAWLPTWAMAALLMAPIGLTMFFITGKMLNALLPNVSKVVLTIAQGVIMALVMESFMASITTYQVNGFDSAFGGVWIKALLAGLPVAAVMSVLMTFFIKPRLEAFMASLGR